MSSTLITCLTSNITSGRGPATIPEERPIVPLLDSPHDVTYTSLYDYQLQSGIAKNAASTDLDNILWDTSFENQFPLDNYLSSSDPPFMSNPFPFNPSLGAWPDLSPEEVLPDLSLFYEPVSTDDCSSIQPPTPTTPLLTGTNPSTPLSSHAYTPPSIVSTTLDVHQPVCLTPPTSEQVYYPPLSPIDMSPPISVDSAHSNDEPKKSKRRKISVTKKKERKKEQNKTAALRYRQRRKDEARLSEERLSVLQQHNGQLKNEILSLESEIEYLKQLWFDVRKAKAH